MCGTTIGERIGSVNLRKAHGREAMSRRFSIKWCGDPRRARELANFFAENVGPDYISHSELQGARALSPSEWRDELPEILEREIEPRLGTTRQGMPGPTSQPILVAEDGDGLLGLSFVTFVGTVPIPFGIVEDLIVHPACRSGGVGTAVIDWIVTEAQGRNIRRLFLETGIHNEQAHHFFERNGFRVCSVVMMRLLD
jgi:GNAT superfamily N-acetyltransferase